MSREKRKADGVFADYEVIHDGLGISYFLPPKRCKTYED
jgi:hypothetical protein